MKVAVFSTRTYERLPFQKANEAYLHELSFFEPRLDVNTVALAQDSPCVCCFVNDDLSAGALIRLARQGTKLIALRCAGFNHVDLVAASELGLRVVRVPQYSPHAIAEHTVGLILSLNRKLHKAYNRVRDGNFALEGLEGFELHSQTVGLVGTGSIGAIVAKILLGFGSKVLAYDLFPNKELQASGVSYVSFDSLIAESDIISLHCPLSPKSKHLIGADAIARMKRGVMLINTSRGALVDTAAVIAALKSERVGSLGIDVYEEEESLFFKDHSSDLIRDDIFARLLTFPNVLVTAHQGFFTHNALEQIAKTTLSNISAFQAGEKLPNEVFNS